MYFMSNRIVVLIEFFYMAIPFYVRQDQFKFGQTLVNIELTVLFRTIKGLQNRRNPLRWSFFKKRITIVE